MPRKTSKTSCRRHRLARGAIHSGAQIPARAAGCLTSPMRVTKRLIELCHADKGHDGRAAHDPRRRAFARRPAGAWLGGEPRGASHAVEAGGNCAKRAHPRRGLRLSPADAGHHARRGGRAQIPGSAHGSGDAGKALPASPAWRTLRLERVEEASVVANTAVKIRFRGAKNAVGAPYLAAADRREVLREKR